jgi:hypothetical protein
MSKTFAKSAGITARGLFVAFLAVIGASSAHAMVTGDWERPVLQSRLDIIEAQPDMANVRDAELVMTRRDGAASVTSLILRMDGQKIDFEIARIKHDACGTELYIGMAKSTAAPSERAYRLVVIDHTHETCNSAPQGNLHELPVHQTIEALLLNQSQPLLRMAGEPEPLISAQ